MRYVLKPFYKAHPMMPDLDDICIATCMVLLYATPFAFLALVCLR